MSKHFINRPTAATTTTTTIACDNLCEMIKIKIKTTESSKRVCFFRQIFWIFSSEAVLNEPLMSST